MYNNKIFEIILNRDFFEILWWIELIFYLKSNIRFRFVIIFDLLFYLEKIGV